MRQRLTDASVPWMLTFLSRRENTSDCGVLYYSDEKVTEFCKAANRAGLQIEMHAIGDKAFVQAVRAIKSALDDLPEDHRHTIIHACLPTAEEIAVSEAVSHQSGSADGVH